MVEHGCEQPRSRDGLLEDLKAWFEPRGRPVRVQGDRIVVDDMFVLGEQFERDFGRAALALEEQLRERALDEAIKALKPAGQVIRSTWNPRGGLPGEQLDASWRAPYDKSG